MVFTWKHFKYSGEKSSFDEGEIIPQLMACRLAQGAAGGDFNCTISLLDCNRNAAQKISPTLRNLVSAFSWKDSFRTISPRAKQFSRHYANTHQ